MYNTCFNCKLRCCSIPPQTVFLLYENVKLFGLEHFHFTDEKLIFLRNHRHLCFILMLSTHFSRKTITSQNIDGKWMVLLQLTGTRSNHRTTLKDLRLCPHYVFVRLSRFLINFCFNVKLLRVVAIYFFNMFVIWYFG